MLKAPFPPHLPTFSDSRSYFHSLNTLSFQAQSLIKGNLHTHVALPHAFVMPLKGVGDTVPPWEAFRNTFRSRVLKNNQPQGAKFPYFYDGKKEFFLKMELQNIQTDG